MLFRLRASFVVAALEEMAFADYLAEVAAGVAAGNGVNSVEIVRGDTSGAATVHAVIEAEEHRRAVSVFRRTLRAVVNAIGPQNAWHQWREDGPVWFDAQ